VNYQTFDFDDGKLAEKKRTVEIDELGLFLKYFLTLKRVFCGVFHEVSRKWEEISELRWIS
jgi:hypothetical protein